MSITIGTQTITKNPAYGTEWWYDRMNQMTQITADGGHVTYDNGPTILRGVIILNNVSKTEGDNFRTWLTGTAIYSKTSFTITPPSATDLGAGAGIALTTAYYDGGPTIEGVFSYIAPGIYNIKFPYWKKI